MAFSIGSQKHGLYTARFRVDVAMNSRTIAPQFLLVHMFVYAFQKNKIKKSQSK